MAVDVYIVFLDNPSVSSETINHNASVPHREGRLLPDGHTHFWRMAQKIKRGTLQGKQVDNDRGYVAQVTKRELLEFWNEYYTEEWYAETESPGYERYHDHVEDVRKYIWSLDPAKDYLLVAVER